MTIYELMKADYLVFKSNSASPDDIKAKIDALHYIQDLAAMTNTNCSTWNIYDKFIDQNGAMLTDQSKINEAFFKAKQEKPEAKSKLGILEQINIKDITAKFRRVHRKHARDSASMLGRRIQEYKHHIAEAEVNILIHQKILDGDTLSIAKVLAQIKAIEDEGFWEFNKTIGSLIIFNAVNDVIITENPDMRKDCTVNFGKIQVSYDFASGLRGVVTRETVNFQNTYVHPHIGINGVCWGDMIQEYQTASKEFNLIKVLNLAAHCVTQYNVYDPYVRVFKFEDHMLKDSEASPPSTSSTVEVGGLNYRAIEVVTEPLTKIRRGWDITRAYDYMAYKAALKPIPRPTGPEPLDICECSECGEYFMWTNGDGFRCPRCHSEEDYSLPPEARFSNFNDSNAWRESDFDL